MPPNQVIMIDFQDYLLISLELNFAGKIQESDKGKKPIDF